MANDAMAITGSRVMVYTSYLDEDIPSQGVVWRVAVWDWKTGDSASLPRLDQSYSTNPAQVLDLKSTDRSALVGWNTQINFLDEFRVVILVNKSDVTELFVFNTLVPQDHPGNLRRLELPQQFHHTAAKICVDRDRSLGTQPLIPDPAQAVLVVELENSWDARVFLVVRTHALIEQTCSTFADPCVPWDEWGRDVMVMEGSMHGGNPHTFVHGAQIVVARVYGTGGQQCPIQYHYTVQTFDFSRRGRSFLPRWGERGGGAEGNVRFGHEGCARFGPGDGMRPLDDLRSLSDGSLLYLVSCPSAR